MFLYVHNFLTMQYQYMYIYWSFYTNILTVTYIITIVQKYNNFTLRLNKKFQGNNFQYF